MYAVAINHLPIKVPLACLLMISVSLALLNGVGLIKVDFSGHHPRLLILLAVYLIILSGIIYLHLKMINQLKVNIRCSDRRSNE